MIWYRCRPTDKPNLTVSCSWVVWSRSFKLACNHAGAKASVKLICMRNVTPLSTWQISCLVHFYAWNKLKIKTDKLKMFVRVLILKTCWWETILYFIQPSIIILGISCFLFSFLFIEVNKQLNTCVQLYSHICTLCILFVLLYNTNVHWFTNKTAFTATAVTWQVGYSIFKILLGRKEEGRKRDGQTRDGQTTDRFSPGGACFAMPKNVNIRPFGHIWGFWTCFQYFLVYLALIWISVFCRLCDGGCPFIMLV